MITSTTKIMSIMLSLPNYERMLEIGGSRAWLHQPRDVWCAHAGSVLAGEAGGCMPGDA